MEQGRVDSGSTWRSDGVAANLLAACLIAAFLSTCWVLNDWARLRYLSLPDTDDMMRLSQIRDWIAGQKFNDWTQYRLSPPDGAPMHWSRIADLGPAAILVFMRPLVGTHVAELSAVIAWPALLFAAYLFVAARLAGRIGGAGARTIALVLAALSYPANTMFLPGRIDHHGLQIVLILSALLALARRPSPSSGIAAGTAIALAMIVGLEAAPQIAAIMAALFFLWVHRGGAETSRLTGFALSLGGFTALAQQFARPIFWSDGWCDAFTPASSNAALVAAGLFMAYAGLGAKIARWQHRLIAGGVIGGIASAALLLGYPVCLTGPYGPVDPFVHAAFIDNVSEARGLFEQDLWGMAFPSVGMIAVATIVAAWHLWYRPLRRWAILPTAAALLISALVIVAQVRGAYLGSAIAVPILAQWVLAARREGRLVRVLASWLLSAGMVWMVVPDQIGRRLAPEIRAAYEIRRACKTPDIWRRLDAYAPGLVMAPIDMGAYLIGGSGHSAVAAGYHRNNAGNAAMYAFFLAPPERARTMALRQGVDYVAICDGDFVEIGVPKAYPDSLAAHLLADRPPEWLVRRPLDGGSGLRFYAVEPAD